MPDTQRSINVFAPAKINLCLHITGKRRSDGYHKLDSLVAFADIGDEIEIKPAPAFSFNITGPFAKSFEHDDTQPHLNSGNLVVKAARALSQITDKALNVDITLTKNLPLQAGLGGGSSDAAATIWGLQEFWKLAPNSDYLLPMMTKLGADVPVCMTCQPTIMRGIGDQLNQAPTLPEIPILLVNPMVNCPTQNVFLNHKGQYKDQINYPDQFETAQGLIRFLNSTDNDLCEAAIRDVPQIKNVLSALKTHKKCKLFRMSGSGASCFGLFDTIDDANDAKTAIQKDNPDWWLRTGWLNRPERY